MPITYFSAKGANNDHSYKQQAHKQKVTGTKKRGCPAAIYMREVIAFPEYKVCIWFGSC